MDLNLIRMILVAILLCIGTVGNILFITVTNKHCKKSSYTVYLAALAISDLLMLYLSIFDVSVRPEVFGINTEATSPVYCKLRLLLTYTLSGVSVWFIVLLALERTFCLYFPFKVKLVCKPKTAFISITLLVTVVTAYNSHYIYGMQLQSISRNGVPTVPSSDMNASANQGEIENVTLPPSKEAVSSSLNNTHNNNNNINSSIIDEFHGIFSRKDIIANKCVQMVLESDSGIQCILAGACNFSETKWDTMSVSAGQSSYVKFNNQTGQPPVDDCKSTNLKSDNLSDVPPLAICISSDLKNVGPKPKQPPVDACNSPCREFDAILPLLENIFKENCSAESRIETQSPTDNRDSNLDFYDTKSTPLPTSLTDNNQIETFCGFLDVNYRDFYWSWVWVYGICLFCLPVIIMVTANMATWIEVYKSSRGNLTNMSALTLRRTRHVVILTSLISVGFIIFTAPLSVLFIVEAAVIEDFKYPLFIEGKRAVFEFIAELLYLCNYSLNFFLYILSGKRFRNSLKAAFCKPTPRQVTPGIQFELQPKQNNTH